MKTGIRRILFSMALALLPALSGTLHAQEGTVKGTLDWERMELSATVTVDLRRAGITLPSGRTRAESLLEDQYLALVRPFIMELQADSSSMVEDMINWSGAPVNIAVAVRRVPPALSRDLTSISGSYTLDIWGLASLMIRHTRPQSINVPLIPSSAGSYTGIIIVADESLPVHGRSVSALAQPCLFPKVWDSNMNLVYERNMIDPRAEIDVPGLGRIKARDWGMTAYAGREAVTRNTPAGLDEELIKRVGTNPLRIMARGVFGVTPTDPIIDRDDALRILSSEQNRRLLREGRVAIILDKTVLRKDIP